MKNTIIITIAVLCLTGTVACKKESTSGKEKDCAAYEVVNNTAAEIDPLVYIEPCDASYVGLVPVGSAGYLTGDQVSLQRAEGIIWEKLRELPVPDRRFIQTYVAELGVFTSSPTTDGASFSPYIMTNVYALEVKYWDTSRVKHAIIVSSEGGLPKDVNASVVINLILEDQTPKTFNATFEDGKKLLYTQNIDMPVSRVRAHWRFWKYKYQNGQKMKVNGNYITEPLGEIEQIETFNGAMD